MTAFHPLLKAINANGDTIVIWAYGRSNDFTRAHDTTPGTGCGSVKVNFAQGSSSVRAGDLLTVSPKN